jgi:pyochelin biosynthesis protein PchG
VSAVEHVAARKLRAIVCGTTFGQVYLAAFKRADLPFELVGVLARGSARSQAVARRYGVPLFKDVDALPADVDVACVVVRSTAMGGTGTDIAKRLMERGIHVMQEHPVHRDELLDCLTIAARRELVYRLSTFYPNLEPVRRFLDTTHRLLTRRAALYVDAACAIQVLYPLLDILGQGLQALRPWQITALPHPGANNDEHGPLPAPFRSLDGVIGGVPWTLRVQNQTDPSDPDNHLHLLHRITIGTASGNLTLLNTHGPMFWSPSMHVPSGSKEQFDPAADPASYLDLPSCGAVGTAAGPTYRRVFADLWPDAVASALLDMRGAILGGSNRPGLGQYHLALCDLWHDVTSRLGYPDLIAGETPEPLSLDDLVAGAQGQTASRPYE